MGFGAGVRARSARKTAPFAEPRKGCGTLHPANPRARLGPPPCGQIRRSYVLGVAGAQEQSGECQCAIRPCTSDGEVYLDLSFITLILPFTSFFTNVTGIGLSMGKLTMAFVVG